jgi:hypothetical protein
LIPFSFNERNQIGELDPAIFEKEIRPKLKTISLLETMRATGLSRTYCGMIRRGVRIPAVGTLS